MDSVENKPLRDKLETRRKAMDTERQSFITHWRDLSEYVQPRRGRFHTSDRNKGNRRHQSIINSHATQALRIARAGLMAGTMSPARPFFALRTQDLDLMEFEPVKIWLQIVERLIRAILNQSNFYNMVPVMLAELLLFGTGCMTHVDDFEDVARFYAHTVGSYLISQNERFIIDTLVREFEMTVEQLVGKWGLEGQSDFVTNAWNKGNYYSWVPVVHFIEPNPDQDTRRISSFFKPFRSIYYEPGANDKQLLSRRGFDRFPAYVPRWDVTGEDVYGTSCPGMDTLGDTKSLQVQERRRAQAIDKMINPPLKGPPSLRNVPINSLPGGTNIYDADGSKEGLTPVYQVQPNIQELLLSMQEAQKRIDTGFYVDMFLAISNMEGIQPRNELDLMQRHEERLLQLGPVLERVHGEFLEMMIDRIFDQIIEAKILPKPPQELSEQDLDVQFISSLALAQRAAATGNIERTAAFISQFAQIPGLESAVDKLDVDQAADEYGSALGAPPKIIRSDDKVKDIRDERAQKQAEAEQMQMMQQAAAMAKDVGGAAAGLGAGAASGVQAAAA